MDCRITTMSLVLTVDESDAGEASGDDEEFAMNTSIMTNDSAGPSNGSSRANSKNKLDSAESLVAADEINVKQNKRSKKAKEKKS